MSNQKTKLKLILEGYIFAPDLDTFIDKFDLGISSFHKPYTQNFEIVTSSEVDIEYIEKVVDKLKEYFRDNAIGKFASQKAYFQVDDYTYKIIKT